MEIEVSKDSKKNQHAVISLRIQTGDIPLKNECKERTFCIGLLFGTISILFLNFKFLMIDIEIDRFYFSTKIYDLRRLWKKERVKSEESWEITMIGRLEINNSHIRNRCDFSRRWRECNWPCIKAKRLMTRPRYMYTAAKRQCKIFRDSLMFCYGSCSLAQTLIDRLVDQRRDHPRGERGRERGDIRENSRDLFATSDENEIENKT